MKEALVALVMRFLELEAEVRMLKSDKEASYGSLSNLRRENAELREGLERARAASVPPRNRLDEIEGVCLACGESVRAHYHLTERGSASFDGCPNRQPQEVPARSHSATCQPAAILSQEVPSPNQAK